MVAAGGVSNRMVYSSDGITWIEGTNAINSFNGSAVVWSGALWVATGGTTTTDRFATSPDGITWTTVSTSVFVGGQGFGIAWNGSLFVAVGSGTSNTIATSPDGIIWTGRGKLTFTSRGRGVAWNGSLFVAVGEGGNTIATSPDGIDWTGRGTTIFSIEGYTVAWNGLLWVAGGYGTNALAYSTNGINWTGRNQGLTAECKGLAWNGSLWVAAGWGGGNTIATSSNGMDWTGRGAVFSAMGEKVAWNGNLFVASGQSGPNIFATSPNGITWTQRTTILTSFVTGFASRRVLPYLSNPIATTNIFFSASFTHPGAVFSANENGINYSVNNACTFTLTRSNGIQFSSSGSFTNGWFVPAVSGLYLVTAFASLDTNGVDTNGQTVKCSFVVGNNSSASYTLAQRRSLNSSQRFVTLSWSAVLPVISPTEGILPVVGCSAAVKYEGGNAVGSITIVRIS
jgi:hypothetical protein